MFRLFIAVMFCLFPLICAAEDELPIELQDFDFANIVPHDPIKQEQRTERISRQVDIIPFIKKDLPEAAIYNIMNPEQVFCYYVAPRPKNYTGYTLDNRAITGFCGELNISQISTTYEALFTKSPNIKTTTADCKIVPEVIIRFVRGVDYTDVMLSSTCPSFTVFYAGKARPFNIIKKVIDDIIKQLTKTNEPFHSPALLKQTVPTAVAGTTAEEDLLAKKQKENKPLQEWKTEENKNNDSANNSKPSSGWLKNWHPNQQSE